MARLQANVPTCKHLCSKTGARSPRTHAGKFMIITGTPQSMMLLLTCTGAVIDVLCALTVSVATRGALQNHAEGQGQQQPLIQEQP